MRCSRTKGKQETRSEDEVPAFPLRCVKYDTSISIRDFNTVYPVSEDSILLIESLDVSGRGTVLEIGCGSGVVALHCAKAGCAVTAVDINPNAADAARYNAKRNGLDMTVNVSDVYSRVNGKFDLIIFNLPYLPADDDGLDALAWSGGEDGTGPLPRVLDGACEHLNEGGRIIVVTSSLMDRDAMDDLLRSWDKRVLGTLRLFFETLSVIELSRS